MPFCKFHAAGQAQSVGWGWVDRERAVVYPTERTLTELLRLSPAERAAVTRSGAGERSAELPLDVVTLLAPVDAQEIWAAGVTYARSRKARMEESTQQDIYDRVYHAARPEIFYKSRPDRCVGPGGVVAVRHDSDWNVPEPELALVLDAEGRVAGYTIGNDVSSRSIEGENPLYLPQAKIYTDSCSLGPWIVFPEEIGNPLDLGIRLTIHRPSVGGTLWMGEASTSQLHRTFDELTACLFAALEFPEGAVLLTGTCIVPEAAFTLAAGDVVTIEIDGIGALTNSVRVLPPRS